MLSFTGLKYSRTKRRPTIFSFQGLAVGVFLYAGFVCVFLGEGRMLLGLWFCLLIGACQFSSVCPLIFKFEHECKYVVSSVFFHSFFIMCYSFTVAPTFPFHLFGHVNIPEFAVFFRLFFYDLKFRVIDSSAYCVCKFLFIF